LTRYDGRREPLAHLDQLTSALPFHLLARPRVLVLGAGAGADVLQALYHDARSIDAVELNAQVVDLVERRFADFSGAPYSAPGVRIHVGEARGFVASHRDRFDVIQVALLDAFGASSAGLYALSESYLYTVEALGEYLQHLAPGGVLAITRWVDLPPRDILKLFATAVLALERNGAQPAQQLALIRGWKTATLLVKNGPLSAADVAALREFCRARSFDVEYFPGIEAAETNRYNVLDQPDFHEGALALLGRDREAFIERYKFNITPATDDRPYFFHHFKWRTLPELLAL
jgi:SAM-dependent methyltransferase